MPPPDDENPLTRVMQGRADRAMQALMASLNRETGPMNADQALALQREAQEMDARIEWLRAHDEGRDVPTRRPLLDEVRSYIDRGCDFMADETVTRGEVWRMATDFRLARNLAFMHPLDMEDVFGCAPRWMSGYDAQAKLAGAPPPRDRATRFDRELPELEIDFGDLLRDPYFPPQAT